MYATREDVLGQIEEATLVRLTDDAGTGAVDEAKVMRALTDASEEIDGYVGSRNAVPLSPVPAIIRKLCVDIAVFNLYARREAVPEVRAERYRNALRFLEKVAQGAISLGADDPEGSPPATDAPRMSPFNPPRLFTRGSTKGF